MTSTWILTAGPEPTSVTKVYVVCYDDGYLSEIKVAFTDIDLAQTHADERAIRQGIGAIVLELDLLTELPKVERYWVYTTSIRVPSGIIERRDVFSNWEWSYDEPLGLEPDETRTSVSGGRRGVKLISTLGYDQRQTLNDHNSQVTLHGGFTL